MKGGNLLTARSVREAVGVFHSEESLQNAVDELMLHGFDRAALSLVAGKHAVEQKLGHAYEKIDELEDDLDVPRIAYSRGDSRVEAEAVAAGGLAYVGAVTAAGAIVASGGALGFAILAAATASGAGGLFGVLIAQLMNQHHARYLEDQLEKGGLLLWVSTPGADRENLASQILTRNGADHVHVHDLPVPDPDLDAGLSYDLSFMNRLGL